MARRARGRGALGSTILGLFCLGASACGSAYAVAPQQASQTDDVDWTIKRAPPTEGTAEPQPPPLPDPAP